MPPPRHSRASAECQAPRCEPRRHLSNGYGCIVTARDRVDADYRRDVSVRLPQFLARYVPPDQPTAAAPDSYRRPDRDGARRHFAADCDLNCVETGRAVAIHRSKDYSDRPAMPRSIRTAALKNVP